MKKYLFLAIAVLSLSWFAFCQVDPVAEDELIEHYDISYYTGKEADPEKHQLNLFLPKNIRNYPTILWIHGGAWAVGGRENETKLARQFARKGIGFVPISYRLSPATWMSPDLNTGIQHPEHAKDCARAFQWLYENGSSYGMDTSKLVMSGYSAGGHLSALLCTDPGYLEAVGLDFSAVKAAVPMAGAYDMLHYYNDHLQGNGEEMANSHVLGVFGKKEGLPAASPTTFIEKAAVPMLVVSETDTYGYTKILEDAAIQANKPIIEFLHVRDKNHNQLYFSLRDDENSEARQEVIEYIKGVFESSNQ